MNSSQPWINPGGIKPAVLGYARCLKKVFITMMVISILVLSMASPARAAVEESVVAQVTVSTFINFTIIDYGNAGLKFGSLIPGSNYNPEVDQTAVGAVQLQLGADSNVDCYISNKANDFTSGSDRLPVKNVTWNTSNNAVASIAMKGQYTTMTTLEPGQTLSVWHWLSVPPNQAPGIYSADFFYQAVKVS